MGASRSSAQLTRKLERSARALASNRPAVTKCAAHAKTVMLARGAGAGLRPGGKVKGRRWNVGYDIKGQQNATAIIGYRGPVHLVNNPTKAHFIGARLLGTRSSLRAKSRNVGTVAAFGGSNRGAFGALRGTRGAKALAWSGGGPVAYAFHPGTRGKRFFETSRAQINRDTPRIYARAGVTEPLKEIFAR